MGDKMKAKILFTALCLMPMMAGAAIPYRVEQVRMPAPETPTGEDSSAFARMHRFYIGGGYNYSMWQNVADDVLTINGKNTSGFEAVAGIRITDTFRIEANYARTDAKWKDLSFTGDTAFVNAIVDARIGNLYRPFREQMLVPYVGAGAGLSWNSSDDATLDDKISPVAAALAGIAVEFGEYFTIDFGYRYVYMFGPKNDIIDGFNASAHQFRAGVRVNF